MKKRFFITATGLMAGFCWAAQPVLIGQDNFDGMSTYLSRTITGGANTATITWNIVNRSTVAYQGMVDTSKFLVNGNPGDGTDDSGFIDSSKTDNVFGMYRAGGTRTLVYTFDISGYTNLSLTMDWATSGGVGDKDTWVAYSIDGAANTEIFRIGNQSTAWTETMEDGRTILRNNSAAVLVNGVAGTHLTDVFQTYNPTIAGAGSTLTVTIVQGSTIGGFGGFGMDNLELYGTSLVSEGKLNLYILSTICL
jgi:hypothetical protein